VRRAGAARDGEDRRGGRAPTQGRSGPRAATPQRPREGRVVGILRTAGDGQRIEVEDEQGLHWQVDCLGEAVAEGARIRFEPVAGGPAPLGVLVRVVEPIRERWVCTLRRIGSETLLVPFGGVEAPRLVLPARRADGARPGDRVLVVRTGEAAGRGRARPDRGRRASPRLRRGGAFAVRVAAVLGAEGGADADHGALVWKHALPEGFSRRARLEAEALPDAYSRSELTRRLDLRDRPFVTIDPESARDHDDALFAEPCAASEVAGGACERLWVAIADVAHVVEEGGFIDAEARRRGNSFYFPDRAIPMLPERLSSGLCSLLPDVDRLVIAVDLTLSAEGDVVGTRFHEAIIRSRARLSYASAASQLAAGGAPPPAAAEWHASLVRLAGIAERLGRRRRRAGAIELELPEVEIEVDASGRPIDARVRARNPAHGLVEEAMLAANRAVARALETAGRETLHRVHPPPEPRRLEALAELVERFGVAIEDELDAPGALAALLEAVRALPARERIHVAALRSLAQARYAPRSGGHFALQFPHYLHFTSPIRRYADLAVHRGLKRLIRRQPAVDDAPPALERLAVWLSGRERVAAEVEREAQAFACCALLAGREGEAFAAEVTGVTEHGLFVRLARPAASGLVPLRSVGLGWQLDLEEEALVGGPAGARIEVGSAVRVRLEAVDGDRGRLAFSLLRENRRPARGDAAAQSADSDSESDSHSR